MNLTLEPEVVTWPETHYVFLQRTGPFQETAPLVWQALHRLRPEISKHNSILGALSQYKTGPRIYRAGYSLSASPVDLPEGIESTRLAGGKYIRFVLQGSYSQLPEASARVWQIVAEGKIQLRDDFVVEHYRNDPQTTPEDQLITEILFPTV